jgi:hypothetical protein
VPDDRSEQHDAVRLEAEAFIAPLLPMLDGLRDRLSRIGINLKHELFVGPWPDSTPQNPIKAGLLISIKGESIQTGGTLYTLAGYMPDQLPGLAAEVEFRVEERLTDPKFGRLWEGIVHMQFRRVRYDRLGDHDHCYCCSEMPAELPSVTGQGVPETTYVYVSEVKGDPSHDIWLCLRCFEYWAPRRNLTLAP